MGFSGKWRVKTAYFCWLGERKGKPFVTVMNEWSRFEIVVKVLQFLRTWKPMTRWNVKGTAAARFSPHVSRAGTKKSLGHRQPWNPSAVYSRGRSSSFMNYSGFLPFFPLSSGLRIHGERTKCNNERISPRVCWTSDGGAPRPPHLVRDGTSQSLADNDSPAEVFL